MLRHPFLPPETQELATSPPSLSFTPICPTESTASHWGATSPHRGISQWPAPWPNPSGSSPARLPTPPTPIESGDPERQWGPKSLCREVQSTQAGNGGGSAPSRTGTDPLLEARKRSPLDQLLSQNPQGSWCSGTRERRTCQEAPFGNGRDLNGGSGLKLGVALPPFQVPWRMSCFGIKACPVSYWITCNLTAKSSLFGPDPQSHRRHALNTNTSTCCD